MYNRGSSFQIFKFRILPPVHFNRKYFTFAVNNCYLLDKFSGRVVDLFSFDRENECPKGLRYLFVAKKLKSLRF